MKRILTSVLTAAILTTPATAVAQPTQQADLSALFNLGVTSVETPDILVIKETPEIPVKAEKPTPVVYIVVEGDNLTKIGTEHNVKWQRLWAKNKELKHPDVIHIGDRITIPLPGEKLKRAIPTAVSLPEATPGVAQASIPSRVAPSFGGNNTYNYGYCTWYVKNRRGSSLPNGLGNANTWYSRARALGMAVGSTPNAGAVGTTTRGGLGHVVYVESVNKDGSINISEMNAPVFGGVTYRTASAGEFLYIY